MDIFRGQETAGAVQRHERRGDCKSSATENFSRGFCFCFSLSMGDLQDPTDGGTVPYFWPYFVGIFPYIWPLISSWNKSTILDLDFVAVFQLRVFFFLNCMYVIGFLKNAPNI